MPQSIAITGQGIICAIGVDCESVLSSLKKEEHGISQIKYLESIHKELPAGEVKLSDNQMKDNLGLPSDREVSRTSLFGAIALKQAMKIFWTEGRRFSREKSCSHIGDNCRWYGCNRAALSTNAFR